MFAPNKTSQFCRHTSETIDNQEWVDPGIWSSNGSPEAIGDIALVLKDFGKNPAI
jgi:hypothetical protein